MEEVQQQEFSRFSSTITQCQSLNCFQCADRCWLASLSNQRRLFTVLFPLSSVCSLLSAGAIVLLGHVGKPTLATIKAYSESLEVPFIFLNNPSHPLEGADSARPSFQFYLQPSISKAIVDIVQWYEWTSLVYIYNTNEGNDLLVMSLKPMSLMYFLRKH